MFSYRRATRMVAVLMGAAFWLTSVAPLTLADNSKLSGPVTEKMSAAAADAVEKRPYPAEVSLIHRRTGWLFRAAPSNLRLYTYDGDSPGKSACNDKCSSSWPPLLAPANATSLGDWTVVTLDDGRKQWAYKGRPAYFRHNDSVDSPVGDGIDGAWHFLEP